MAKTKQKISVDDLPQLTIKLGKRIKDLRIRNGYTSHEAFANAFNINRTQYFRYEKGEDLRFSSLVKLVSAFNMSLEDFFAEGF